MSYFDFAGALKVIEVFSVSNPGNGTVSPIGGVRSGGSSTGSEETEAACLAASPTPGTWTGGTFTRSFDARPYMGALFVLSVGTMAATSLDVRIQQSSEPEFGSWADCTKFGGGTAAFAQITPAGTGDGAPNAVHYCKVDFTQAQNAVGVKAIIAAPGAERVRYSITAVCFPYDTTNASEPQFNV